jgi:hypothetical protein
VLTFSYIGKLKFLLDVDELYMLISGCSYFLIEDSGVLVEEQKGIVRTNCIDCLDRTNVAQVYPEKNRKEKKRKEKKRNYINIF